MRRETPDSRNDLAGLLRDASGAGEAITLGGSFSKRSMAGPCPEIGNDVGNESGVVISTARLNRVLQFEPKDLTISVEAGMKYRDLARRLRENGQMLPLDPPYADDATIGGVVAANCSGPRRRLYGTARDMVIGMTFVTADGVARDTGGMVVKNVAGLDVQKALIGSFGTLAAIASVNFRLYPLPEATRTFVLHCPSVEDAVARRDAILKGVLQPAAIDVVNARAAARIGLEADCVILRAGGGETLLDRYSRELPGAETFDGEREVSLWRAIEEFPAQPPFLVKVSHPPAALTAVFQSSRGACLARAGSGVSYLAFEDAGGVRRWMADTGDRGWSRVVERAPEDQKASLDLWPSPGPDLDLLIAMKALFDPKNLLNRGRLYGRI